MSHRLELAHCPHCTLTIAESVSAPFPPQPLRCPHCQLIIGAGRASETAEEGQGTRGAAAGRYANQARGQASAGIPKAEALDAIDEAAEAVGCKPAELTMLDYREQAETSKDLPGVPTLLGSFGTWKSAMAAARRRRR